MPCDTRPSVCGPLHQLFERAATTPKIMPGKTAMVGGSAGCRKTKSSRFIGRHSDLVKTLKESLRARKARFTVAC